MRTIHIGFGEREGRLWQWIFWEICGNKREGDREEYVRIAAYVLTITIIVIAFHSFKKLFSISASSIHGTFTFATLLRKPLNMQSRRIYFTCVNQLDVFVQYFPLEAFFVLFFLIESYGLIFMENNNFSHRRNGESRSGSVTSRFLSFSLWWAHSVKLRFSVDFILFRFLCIFFVRIWIQMKNSHFMEIHSPSVCPYT